MDVELAVPCSLKLAIAVSSAGGAFWSFPGEGGGQPRGVSVDLGCALAAKLGLGLDLVAYPNSNAITEAAGRGEWDVTFIPFDQERSKHLDFGPVYNRSESTLLMRPELDGDTVDDLDRPGLRILAVEKTTTGRALAAWVKRASVIEVPTIDQIAQMIAAGEADAFAMSRDSLERMAKDIPGSRVARGRFFAASTAVATPPGHNRMLQAASNFLRGAMRDGTLRRILDANGMTEAEVPMD